MRYSFILLAGGNGSRFRSDIPKQYHKIAGKTLIDISINKIDKFKEIKKIVLVYNGGHKKYLKNIKQKKVFFVKGGNTRRKSTYIALNYLKKRKVFGKVLIHDAARPNFSRTLLEKIIKNSKKKNTVIPILNLEDALKKRLKKSKVMSIKKDKFFITQTPQCFNLDDILKLHIKYKDTYVDDDYSLVNSNNIKLISGEKRNFKITNQEDFDLLKKFYNSTLKIGIGFDVHRLVIGKKLFLGGVKIPSKLGTLGHSDGDPLLHALIDAILGACNMGDIGERFSDKKKMYKNISSTILIKKVIKEVRKKNYAVNNIDINIITEKPKLKKFKKKITLNISNLCDLPHDRINIKAKTTEKLGVIGKEKAIATEVIVSMFKYD